MSMPLAHLGPLSPEAILLALGLLVGLAALTIAWVIAFLTCSLLEALTLTLGLAVLWKRDAATHWFWRHLALSSVLGVSALFALVLNARIATREDGGALWVPLAIAAPFAIAFVGALTVQAVRSIGRVRAALRESSRDGTSLREASSVLARGIAARTLAFLGMALGAAGAFGAAGFVVLAIMEPSMSATDRVVASGFGLLLFITGAALALVPWWLARAGGRLVAAPARAA